MKETETQRRRQRSRHPLRWKAAIAFDTAQDRPVVHTQTQDLSASGAAMFSEYGDLTGTDVTLLLACPPRKDGEAPKVLKVRARVVSTARTPGMSKYRHGLSFIRSSDDGLDVLAEMLKSIAAEAPRGKPATAAPAAIPALSATGNRLAQLKQLAQAKLAEGKTNAPKIATNDHISDALKRSFLYLKDLAVHLNVVQPEYPKGYAIAGIPEFNGLTWGAGHTEFHTREMSPSIKLYDRVSLRFVLSGKKQIRVDREYPASEKLRQLLTDSKIEFATHEARNARGAIERSTFVFPCKIVASVLLSGQFDTGKLLLRTSNVSGFGAMEQILAPEAVTGESLDEFAGFILSETGRLGPLLLRNA